MTPPGLRILMTADAVGGVWVFASGLARYLCAQECEVLLVTLGPPPRREQIGDLAGTPGLRLEITDLALEWLDPAGDDFSRACRELFAIERAWRPDVIHLNSYREAVAAWTAPVIVTAHSCVHSWWRACRGADPDEPRWQIYAANVAAGLAAAQQWAAPTEAFRAVVEHLYRPPTSGASIHNGLAARPRPAKKRPVILAAGRLWDEAKNVALLARIAERVPWPVEAAGSIAAPDARSRRPLLHDVNILGELSHVAMLDQMCSAAVVASPALYEPFGLAILEAAAAGCALVLADIPTFRELWSGAALFVDPRDDDRWCEMLTRVARDAKLRRKLQMCARERALAYSLEDMAAAYGRLYERALDRTVLVSALARAACEVRP
ncbi:MAG TPA: glycosyltransferase family 4 protein [Pseudolabrys sp.]|nr:glycosyltransferase family 4 protein [Pseudolabrys sp.]